jgi:hypothetical protein
LIDNTAMLSRRTVDAHASILRDLNEERAAALMRIGRTLESLLDQLQAARAAVLAAGEADRERELAAWRALRARAVKYRWYLEVQREALGLRQHRYLDEFYPIPREP